MHLKTPQKVDRHSSLPVYQQIAADLLSRISQNEWRIGDKLPSEGQLSEEYQSSRVTVRQALSKLEYEGYIDKQRGKGTFVKANPSIIVQDLYIPQIGVKKKSDIVSADVKISIVPNAGSKVWESLALEPESPVTFVERLFLRKGRVIGLNRAWFPVDKVPGMAEKGLINNSITDTLQQRYHIEFTSVENYIESFSMDAAMAQILNTTSPSPALKISSVYKGQEGIPVEYAVTVWNGKDTQFHVILSSK